ncbi:MAG: sodium:solute symporter [Cyanobacteria bacterium]|nr:sodium:solute symporter [Cyanobacteriota bacterium]
MRSLDWIVVAAYLFWVVGDGLRQAAKSKDVENYLVAGRSLPWWLVGLSVMATQLSAITMIGTTGQAYINGMRFLQNYYALPLAMVILSLTLVPFFHKANVFTAYQYLETRFDGKVRSFTALLFLFSRSLSCSVVISAPAVVMSVILGWNVTLTCLLIGVPTTIFTMFGGVRAIAYTDFKQMFAVVASLLIAVTVLIAGLPHTVGVGDALRIAGTTGRLQMFDFRLDFTEQYTFWSGTIAALFLFLSYFGTDQSQVQRYLSAKSADEARSSLLMSAFWKIPLQALVLIVGVLTFTFYLFVQPPMLFNPVHDQKVRDSARAGEYTALEQEFNTAIEQRRTAASQLAAADVSSRPAATAAFKGADDELKRVRAAAVGIVKEVSGDRGYNDVNYVFPTFVTTRIPMGLAGLIVAAILVAAMSASSAELSALSTATVIDFYKRFGRKDADDAHVLRASRLATLFWGLFASVVAIWAVELGSLIEVVNRFGSLFYGSILGVFILAVGFPRANSAGALAGMIAGMTVIVSIATFTKLAFLWHNPIGAIVVVSVGLLVSEFTRQKP